MKTFYIVVRLIPNSSSVAATPTSIKYAEYKDALALAEAWSKENPYVSYVVMAAQEKVSVVAKYSPEYYLYDQD